MSDIPIEQHHDNGDDGTATAAAITLEGLTRELETLLDAFCSDAQQRFILDQQIASPQQLQRVHQTIQQIRNATGDLLHGPNSEAIRQSLMRASLEMLEYYQLACRERRLRHLPDDVTHQLPTNWRRLSEMFEHKAKEQARLTQLYDRLSSLRKAWKQPRHMERLLTTLLAATTTTTTANNFELLPGAYLVVVDRYNYCQLGLKRKAIGSRQLIFDDARIGRKEQKDEVARVCDRFASVFARNAQHNLAQIEAQVQLAQLTHLSGQIERLHETVYDRADPPHHPQLQLHQQQQQHSIASPDEMMTSSSTSSSSSSSSSSTSSTSDSGNNNNNNTISMSEEVPPHPHPHPPNLQLPLQGTSSFIYIQDPSMGLQNLPMPSFVPSPWEWADLLKVRRPYSPVLFGLFKHRQRPSGSSVTEAAAAAPSAAAAAAGTAAHASKMRFWPFSWSSTRTHTIPPPPPQQQQHESFHYAGSGEGEGGGPMSARVQNGEGTFASVSFKRLCSHFCRRGMQFYEDVATNAHIKQGQDRRLLQHIGQDLVKLYAAIQLGTSRAYMHRILAILHDMALLGNQQLLQSNSNSGAGGGGGGQHPWEASVSQPPLQSLVQLSERDQERLRSGSRIESNISYST